MPRAPLSGRYTPGAWTGTELVIAGGSAPGENGLFADAAALAYSPTTNRWRQLPTMDSTRMNHVAVWTGTRLIVWGGQTAQRMPPAHGESYDPATNQWTPLPVSVLNGR